MLGVVGMIAFLTVLGLSLLITKTAAVALSMTGLSWESARFQARSAFTGTGFTTSESRKVVDHPVRRRIILWLMTLRSAGIMTIIISLILTLGFSEGERQRLTRLAWLIGGIVFLIVLSKSRLVDRGLRKLIQWAMKKWTDLDVRDYASLLKLSGDYRVMELHVKEGDWLACKNINACRLPEEGIRVIGIYRSEGDYLGVPSSDTEIYPGDTVILYGRSDVLRDLDTRKADKRGEEAHQKAKHEQKRHAEKQKIQERVHKEKREGKNVKKNNLKKDK